jgi:hypothetical protein
MSKVAFLLLFLSTSTTPQYYYKGMWFQNMQQCEDKKEHQINKMLMEAEIQGFKDTYIDARCMEMDIKEFKKTLGT